MNLSIGGRASSKWLYRPGMAESTCRMCLDPVPPRAPGHPRTTLTTRKGKVDVCPECMQLAGEDFLNQRGRTQVGGEDGFTPAQIWKVQPEV